ncbi:MAG: hypothetical protein LBH18_06200 [Spirochaetaceae bacterium]|jgi:hypothetical protein|nr:hypothetical protein [Spirochaetaceae bacterium]
MTAVVDETTTTGGGSSGASEQSLISGQARPRRGRRGGDFQALFRSSFRHNPKDTQQSNTGLIRQRGCLSPIEAWAFFGDIFRNAASNSHFRNFSHEESPKITI